MRRAVLGIVAVTALLAASACASSCRQPPQYAEQPWGQGYESPQGYMQPDHGFWYYWFMYNILQSSARPTYHVYVPPTGYPTTYRPWHPDPTVTIRRSWDEPSYGTPTQVPASSYAPRQDDQRDSRKAGGFSRDRETDSRKTGGFSPTPRPQPAPSQDSRKSGGFSQPSKPSSGSDSRKSGGFGGGSSGSRRK